MAMQHGPVQGPDSTADQKESLPKIPSVHHRIFGRVHLFITTKRPADDPAASFAYLDIKNQVVYDSFCNDFGPMNLLATHKFCLILDNHILQNLHRSTAICSDPTPECLTNVAFLLGAYMIMRMQMTCHQAVDRLSVPNFTFTSFRDILAEPSTFELQLTDCLEALSKAKELGWIDFSENAFDPDEYAYFDNPLNADLHEIVPNKIVSMRCPRELDGEALWSDVLADGRFSHRDFSPAYYNDILPQFGVQAVVRLCAPQYSREAMAGCGAGLADLPCDDTPLPPPDVVAKFMAIAEGLPGAVALQSKAGLGRTGVLAGLYMMKHHGFTARQAIAWVRIVRPGSIIGAQQAFLVEQEGTMRCGGRGGRPGARAGEPTQADASWQESALQARIDAILDSEACRPGPALPARRASSASFAAEAAVSAAYERRDRLRAQAWRDAVRRGGGGSCQWTTRTSKCVSGDASESLVVLRSTSST